MIGVHVEEARLASEVAHAVQARIPVLEQHVPRGRHVDHPVIGRDDDADVAPEPERGPQRAVDLLERVAPAVGVDAVLVAGLVELGQVAVHERAVLLLREGAGDLDALREIALRGELRAAMQRRREPAPPVLRGSDRIRLEAGGGRALEHRLTALPRRGIEPVLAVAADLVLDDVAVGVQRPVPDEPVDARPFAREERRQRRGGRRGVYGLGDVLLRHRLRQGARVGPVCAQLNRSEPVDDERDRRPHGGSHSPPPRRERSISGATPARFRAERAATGTIFCIRVSLAQALSARHS